MEWMHRHLEHAHFRVVESKNFSILHGEDSIIRQVRVAQSKLDLMNPAIRAGMGAYLMDLRCFFVVNACNTWISDAFYIIQQSRGGRGALLRR